jgi:hypothetical protein
VRGSRTRSPRPSRHADLPIGRMPAVVPATRRGATGAAKSALPLGLLLRHPLVFSIPYTTTQRLRPRQRRARAVLMPLCRPRCFDRDRAARLLESGARRLRCLVLPLLLGAYGTSRRNLDAIFQGRPDFSLLALPAQFEYSSLSPQSRERLLVRASLYGDPLRSGRSTAARVARGSRQDLTDRVRRTRSGRGRCGTASRTCRRSCSTRRRPGTSCSAGCPGRRGCVRTCWRTP